MPPISKALQNHTPNFRKLPRSYRSRKTYHHNGQKSVHHAAWCGHPTPSTEALELPATRHPAGAAVVTEITVDVEARGLKSTNN